MSRASDFETMARNAEGIYELIGKSGKSYIFFFFADRSVTAARKLPSARRGTRLDFANVNVKEALRAAVQRMTALIQHINWGASF